MIPAAPLVGAVTTRPPPAFSSFTASAHRFTQSSAAIVSLMRLRPAARSLNLRCSAAARRRTFSPPGSTPSCVMPRATQPRITSQMRASAALVSASLRHAVSFASINSLMRSPWARHCASISAPVSNG